LNPWLWLAAAIGFEIVATLALRSSHGFTVPWAVAALAVGYVASFYCLSLALRHIPLSSAYAIWSAAGTTIITLVGILAFDEPRTALKLVSIVLVVTGIVGLRLA
jgi:small multidrug resistance pump